MKKTLSYSLSASLLLLTAGCGGGGGGGASSAQKGTGWYIDGGIVGVEYRCGGYSGMTGSDGSFDLEVGKGCTFSLHGITLRSVPGSAIHDRVYILEDNIRVARVLQTLDPDGNPDNGITIPDAAAGCLGTALPESDGELQELAACLDRNMSAYNGSAVSETEARNHLARTVAQHTPVSDDLDYETDEDRPIEITLRGRDLQNDPLSYEILTRPEHGRLEGSPPRLTYTPAVNWHGSDRFTYRVSDGTFESNVSTVTLTVRSVNDAPVAADDTATLAEDTNSTIDVLANDSDADGDELNISAVTVPAHGTAVIMGTVIRYTPVRDFNGNDSFRYTVTDGHGGTAEAVVTLTVTPVNDTPVADNLSLELPEDGSRAFTLPVSDADGDSLSYTLLTQPEHGTLSGTAPDLIYTPAPDWHGEDGFQYRVNDGVSDSAVATVTLTVTSVNDAPVVRDIVLNTTEGASVAVDLNGSDADGDPLSYRVVSGPSHGSLEGTAPHLTYTPDANYTGTDSFRYVANDGSVDSEAATVSITVESNATDGNVTVSGTVTYDLIPPKSDYRGLDFNSITRVSAKRIIVQAIDSAGNLLAETSTDLNGSYSLSLAPNTPVKIRVLAKMYREGAPAWDIKVVDNTNEDALYVMEGALADTGTSDSIRNLNAPSGWDGESFSAPRIAAPFAILDSINHAVDRVLEANASTAFPPLVVNWSPNNKAASGDKSQGEITTSHYVAGNLYILGDANANGDTDEYDNHVITHEWGHYYEDMFSRSDSIGGSHSGGEYLDIRVAFGEGWGNAFSAISLDDPIYFDTYYTADSESTGWSMDIESGNRNNPGWFSESSVQRIIYDLYDEHDDGDDRVSLGFAPIHRVFTGAQKSTHAFTSLFSFISYLKEQNSDVADDIDSEVASENIATIEDIYGEGRTNHPDDYPYHSLTLGSSVQVSTTNSYGIYNKLGNRKYVRFTVESGGSYTVTIAQNGESDADPDFRIYRASDEGLVYVGRGEASGSTEEDSFSLQAGDYLIDMFDYNNIDNANFDVTVSQ